jgi:RES domain-containing protein
MGRDPGRAHLQDRRRRLGDGARNGLLLVPSVIVPGEYNVSINPRHHDAAAIGATTLKRWHDDPRLCS